MNSQLIDGKTLFIIKKKKNFLEKKNHQTLTYHDMPTFFIFSLQVQFLLIGIDHSTQMGLQIQIRSHTRNKLSTLLGQILSMNGHSQSNYINN